MIVYIVLQRHCVQALVSHGACVYVCVRALFIFSIKVDGTDSDFRFVYSFAFSFDYAQTHATNELNETVLGKHFAPENFALANCTQLISIATTSGESKFLNVF